jgi:hypothetical protein
MNHSRSNGKGFGKTVPPAYTSNFNTSDPSDEKFFAFLLSDKATVAYQQNPDLVDEDLKIAASIGLPVALENKDGSVKTIYDLSKQHEKTIAKLHIFVLCGITAYPVLLSESEANGGQN